MRFVIEGEPIGKARPRFMQRGGHVITYDPQQETKAWIKFELEQQLKKALDSNDKSIVMQASNLTRGKAYIVQMTFYIKVPESWPESRRNEALWGIEPCICKPDLDNMEKFYLDCCSNSLFPDDKQVFLLTSTKKYANKPKIVIDIMSKIPMSINDKAKGILNIFGPEQLMMLIENVWELFKLYDVDEEDDWVVKKVGEEDAREVRLARTAYILSLVASNHSKAFDKIQRKYPDFWKDAERIEREVSAARKGDFSNVLEERDEKSKRDVPKETNDRIGSAAIGASKPTEFQTV